MTLSNSSSLTSLEARVQRRHAGVVDEHVDVPELGVRGVDEAVEVVPVADVGGDGSARRPVALVDLGGQLVARRPACGWR